MKIKRAKSKVARKLKPIQKIKRRRKKRVVTKADVTVSKAEVNFMKFLNEIGIEVETQFQLAYKFYDFKVKDKNIIVEFDGDYFHCNPKKYPDGPICRMQKKNIENDKFKDSLAKVMGYKIIRVWENDFNKEKEKLKDRLIKEIID